jgi:hypothetical protein
MSTVEVQNSTTNGAVGVDTNGSTLKTTRDDVPATDVARICIDRASDNDIVKLRIATTADRPPEKPPWKFDDWITDVSPFK